MLTGNTHRLADVVRTFLEDAVRTATNVFGRNARELLVTHGHRDRKYPVFIALWPHAEVDEVVPIERRQKEGGGYAKLVEGDGFRCNDRPNKRSA